MKDLQEHGLVGESLYYAGSSSHYHYFYHTSIDNLIYGGRDDFWREYRVSRSELFLENGLERPYRKLSKKEDPSDLRYCAITEGPPYLVKFRESTSEKSKRYGREMRDGSRAVKVKPVPDGYSVTTVRTDRDSGNHPGSSAVIFNSPPVIPALPVPPPPSP